MGLRLRLRAGFDIAAYTGGSRVVLEALRATGCSCRQRSGWYITGATDTRWNDDDLNQLKGVPAAFEAVDTGPIGLAEPSENGTGPAP